MFHVDFFILFFGFSGNHLTASSRRTDTDEPPHHYRFGCVGSKTGSDRDFEPAVMFNPVVMCAPYELE